MGGHQAKDRGSQHVAGHHRQAGVCPNVYLLQLNQVEDLNTLFFMQIFKHENNSYFMFYSFFFFLSKITLKKSVLVI